MDVLLGLVSGCGADASKQPFMELALWGTWPNAGSEHSMSLIILREHRKLKYSASTHLDEGAS